MSTGTPLGIGTVVAGTYEITGLLGRGGMGAVWAAKHLRLPGKRAAIKVLLAGMDDPQALARFRREAEIASRLGHPNIVGVLDFNTLDDGTPYQILELYEGESLGARLQRGALTVEETLRLARQVGSALAAAHRAGVVHRDLKPDNIFLCPSEAGGELGTTVRVLDFGISKIQHSQTVKTQDQVLIGTPQYMAPEQASGQNQSVDQRADIFALGAIVYEMLTGRGAFAGDSLVAVVMNVLTATPEPLAKLAPHVPSAVSAAVEKALAKKADERFQDVAAFIAALTGRPLETLDGKGNAAPRLSAEDVVAPTMASGQAGVPVPRTLMAPSSGGAPTGAAPVSATVAPSETRSIPRLAIAAVAGVLIVGAGVFLLRRPVEITRPTIEPTARFVEPARPALPPPAVPAPVAIDAAPSAPVARPTQAASRAARPVAAEQLPVAVRAELDQADQALGAGDTRAARRLAEHSLLTQRSSRAFSILTRVACRGRDLANARGYFRSVSAGDRPGVLRACAAAGLDLK